MRLLLTLTRVLVPLCALALAAILFLVAWPSANGAGLYVVVDTGQAVCYDEVNEITCPLSSVAFYGQDAQYDGNQPSYTLSGDGLTVYDNNTGLTWQQSPDTDGDSDIDAADKLSWTAFGTYPATLNVASFGGYDDWRRPTIKELYSLIDFSGIDPSGYEGSDASGLVPFIDTIYFDFAYGDTSAGERIIDAQYWSSTQYVGTIFGGDAGVFGVNFADGRIKGYPRDTGPGGSPMTEFVRLVRGNTSYGVNDFVDNGDGTVTDQATELMWQQADDGVARDWADSLSYAESLTLAGHNDWRLPNAKELQGLLDYTRSPSTTSSAAISPLFSATQITDEGGGANYGFYWTGTTHANLAANSGEWAAYVAFGEALGWMEQPPPGSGNYVLQDVHGAGAQRSDPKTGDPATWPNGNGPQGDVIRIFNLVRAVRTADVTPTPTPTPTPTSTPTPTPSPTPDYCASMPWPVPAGDDDCDGFDTVTENFIGTDASNPCAADDIANNEGLPDKWPVDNDDNQFINTFDVVPYIPALNSVAPGPPYAVRLDLNASGNINTFDVVPFIQLLNEACLP